MQNSLPKSVRNLIEEFSKLPGIGPKSAQRLAIHLLHCPSSKVAPLGDAVLKLKENVLFCSECFHIAEDDPCIICSDGGRDKSVICVVEEVLDVAALEKTGDFNGVYHVLHGALSPIDGISPEHLKCEELFARVERGPVREVILATNPSLEGEATALYLQKGLMKNESLKITRIARGLPVGAELEYADSVTLSRAILGRVEF